MLITGSHLKEQRRMHANKRFGAASVKFAPDVAALIEQRKPRSILDYGAGKCALREALGAAIDGVEFVEYDPGIKRIAKLPRRTFEMVCCIDVLEHVEAECLDDVLSAVRAKTQRVALVTIHTGPAGKIMSDGRNAHITQQPIEWWAEKLRCHFSSVDATLRAETTVVAICEV